MTTGGRVLSICTTKVGIRKIEKEKSDCRDVLWVQFYSIYVYVPKSKIRHVYDLMFFFAEEKLFLVFPWTPWTPSEVMMKNYISDGEANYYFSARNLFELTKVN